MTSSLLFNYTVRLLDLRSDTPHTEHVVAGGRMGAGIDARKQAAAKHGGDYVSDWGVSDIELAGKANREMGERVVAALTEGRLRELEEELDLEDNARCSED